MLVHAGIKPDFITVDGGEGGTGAAPPEFSNSVGFPMVEGLSVRRNHEFCTKNEELCIKDEEFCIKNEECFIKNGELCRWLTTSLSARVSFVFKMMYSVLKK